MSWHTIPGWFDFQDIYNDAVAQAADGARFCEVGTFLGRSLVYLGERIVASGKAIELHSVDRTTVIGTREIEEHPDQALVIATLRGKLLSDHLAEGMADNVRKGLRWEHHVADSVEAAWGFPDDHFDFVFIDADHEARAVWADLHAWGPKVKVGGVMAGHDHTPSFPGVQMACEQYFGRPKAWKMAYEVIGSSWRAYRR